MLCNQAVTRLLARHDRLAWQLLHVAGSSQGDVDAMRPACHFVLKLHCISDGEESQVLLFKEEANLDKTFKREIGHKHP